MTVKLMMARPTVEHNPSSARRTAVHGSSGDRHSTLEGEVKRTFLIKEGFPSRKGETASALEFFPAVAAVAAHTGLEAYLSHRFVLHRK